MNYTLFMGFTSIPFNDYESFRNRIHNLFNSIKENRKNVEEGHYNPVFYHLFGDYDLLILSPVDDTEFALRTFTPYNPGFGYDSKAKLASLPPLIKKPTPPFDHQILLSMGINGISNCSCLDFHTITKTFPLVSVIRIKLSTYLLMGYGVDFKNPVMQIIKERLISHIGNGENGKWVIAETFAWNELTLLIFNNEYETVFEFLGKIRNIKVQELDALPNSDRYKNLDNVDVTHPVIKSTHTTFGYNPNHKNLSKTKITPITTILTKGNSIHSILDYLKREAAIGNKFNVRYCIGNTDIILLPKPELIDSLNIAKENSITIDDIQKLIEEITLKHSINVISFKSIILDLQSYVEETKGEPYTRNICDNLVISEEDIKKVLDKMRQKGINKIQRDGILNVFAEYNCGVQDPYLYGYFLDLHYFLRDLIRALEDEDTYLHHEIYGYIEQVMQTFSIAYNNRFLQSFMMNDITDNNIFFKGGVQNLIGAYSVVQIVICDVTGNKPKIVYVHGHADIVSGQIGIGLNYIHLMQPLLVIHHIIYENILQKVARIRREMPSTEPIMIGIDQFIQFWKGWKIKQADILEERSTGMTKRSWLDLYPYKKPWGETLLLAMVGEKNENKIEIAQKRILQDYVNVFLERFNEASHDNEFFEHVVTDFIVYKLLFNKNIELMKYVYWGVFASNSENYKGINYLNENRLMEFLLRLLFLDKLTTNEPNSDIAQTFLLREQDSMLLSVFNLIIDEEIVKDFFTRQNFLDFSEVLTQVETEVLWKEKEEESALKDEEEDSVGKDNMIFIDSEQVWQIIFGNIRKYNKNSKNKEATFVDKKASLNYLALIVTYFFNYSKKLKEKYFDYTKISVLERNAEKGPNPGKPKHNDNYNKFLYDQLGGYFINDSNVRSDYLTMRSELIKILTQLSYEKKFGLLHTLTKQAKKTSTD